MSRRLDRCCSCGRPDPPSGDSPFSDNNEANIDFYFYQPCSLNIMYSEPSSAPSPPLSAPPDYPVVLHPKEELGECLGEVKGEKSQFSQPHWWLPYGFWWKAPPDPSTQLLSTAHCCGFDVIVQVFCLFLQSAPNFGEIIVSLFMVPRWAGWSGFDWPAGK